ncbi:MAG TPA: sigma-70 family RNA polymerase sigma factor, partial [Pirellula sp.]|nr:sigma-70 family RNA polymerase sigma factor [Pirellula sp.]
MTHPAPPEGIASDSQQTGDDHRLWLHATFERLERPLIAYALRLLGGKVEAALDCVQESFLRLCRENQSHVEGHVDAWLFKTCRNRAMDHHREEARMIIDSNSSALATALARSAEPAGHLAQREEQVKLQDQIARLPTREQEVLSLRLGQGLSYKQIAEIT